MKFLQKTLLIFMLMVLVGCEEKSTMRIYGDDQALDNGLQSLQDAFKQAGALLVVASKYEIPDVVIVNGLEALRNVEAVYNTPLLITDTLEWKISSAQVRKKSVIFIFGSSSYKTVKGLEEYASQRAVK